MGLGFHIMFADDLLLFGKATKDTMESIMIALELCSSLLGQQFGFKEARSSGRYLVGSRNTL